MLKPLFFVTILFFTKIVFSYATKGAYKVIGKVFKLGTWGDAIISVACSLVINPSANVAYILFHFNFLQNLFYFLKIGGAVLAKWAYNIFRQGIAFIYISAYFANKSFFTVGLWFWFYVIVIITVGHGIFV